MKKTITRTTQQAVIVCDLCDRDASNGAANCCYLCRREVCLTCRQLLFCRHSGDGQLIDFTIYVCKKCLKDRSEYVAAIESCLASANREIKAHLAAWKQSTEE